MTLVSSYARPPCTATTTTSTGTSSPAWAGSPFADLDARRLQACFDLLARQRTRNGNLIATSTVDRVRATLRSALNAAIREGLIAATL